jgi:hypothetical protein
LACDLQAIPQFNLNDAINTEQNSYSLIILHHKTAFGHIGSGELDALLNDWVQSRSSRTSVYVRQNSARLFRNGEKETKIVNISQFTK